MLDSSVCSASAVGEYEPLEPDDGVDSTDESYM